MRQQEDQLKGPRRKLRKCSKCFRESSQLELGLLLWGFREVNIQTFLIQLVSNDFSPASLSVVPACDRKPPQTEQPLGSVTLDVPPA